MAVTGLSISGRLVEGETLTAWALGSVTALRWQALVGGQWVNVGNPDSASFVIPAGASGTAYRLSATIDGAPVTSEPTGATTADTRKNAAPVLSGPDLAALGGEHFGPSDIFDQFTLTDADRASYGGGSLLVQNTNAGDAFDVLSIRTTPASGFSFNAATRELTYTGGNRPAIVGTVDATLDGNGKALKVAFTSNATAAIVDSLVNHILFANNDDSPTASRLLTLRITDGSGASAQRVFAANTTPEPDAPVFTSAPPATVAENQQRVGAFAAIDPDREAGEPQGITFSLVAGEGSQDNARFTLDAATGVLRFVTTGDYEDATHSPTYSVRVRATDGEGSTTELVHTVTLLDVNDAPVFVGAGFGSVSEAGASGAGEPVASGNAFVIDPDAGDTRTFAGSASGTYGRFDVHPTTGAWTYTLDNASAATQALSSYDVKDEVFTLSVTDRAGASASTTVRLTVWGADDAPVATGGDTTGLVNESAGNGMLVLANGAARGSYSAAVDAGGSLVLLGSFADPPPGTEGLFGIAPGQAVYRFNPDGTLAQSFTVNFGPGSIDLDASGHYLLGKTAALGSTAYSSESGPYDFAVTRYLASGQLDTAFGSGGTALVDFAGGVDTLRDVVPLADGRLLLAGDAAGSQGRVLEVARLLADGALDTSFGTAGRVTFNSPVQHDGAWRGVAAADGSVIAWGEHMLQGGAKEVHLVRLLPDGSVDSAFGSAGFLNFPLGTWYANRGADVEVDAQGRVVIGWGAFDYESAVGYRPLLTRLNADGTPDVTFGTGGTADTQVQVAYGSTFDIAFDAQGRIVLTGDPAQPGGDSVFMVARFLASGERDTAFGTGGVAAADLGDGDTADLVFALPGGDIVLAGHADEFMASDRAAFARLNGDGSLEQGFGGPADEAVSGVLTATDVDTAPANLVWSGTANGVYGAFTMFQGGSWEYRVDNSRPATQALGAGQGVTETFTATVRDDFGATATQQVVVTVMGAYDAPLT